LALVIITVPRAFGVNVGIDRVRDGGVGAACLVLIDERGSLSSATD
jgi:hypothetical protein